MSDERFVQIERRAVYAEDEFWEMIYDLEARKYRNLLPPQLPIEDLPTKRAKNFVAAPDAPVPDCLTCGACCVFLFAVGVLATDRTPPEAVWQVTDAAGETVVDAYLRRDAETLQCRSLRPTADGLMPCGIYEERPTACRNFEAGSDRCRALRRVFGREPFLTLEEMSHAQRVLERRAAEFTAAPPATIRDARIVENNETGAREIVGELHNGERETIHSYDPARESWRQFQFCGMTVPEARRLIELETGAATDNL